MQDGCTLFYQSKQTSRNLLGVSTQKVVSAVLCRDSVELHFSLSQAAAREFAYEALPFGRSTRRRFQSCETKIQELALHDVMRRKYSMDHQWSASQVSDAWLGIHGFQSVWVWLTKKCLANACKPINTSNRFMSYDSYGSKNHYHHRWRAVHFQSSITGRGDPRWSIPIAVGSEHRLPVQSPPKMVGQHNSQVKGLSEAARSYSLNILKWFGISAEGKCFKYNQAKKTLKPTSPSVQLIGRF